MYVKFAFSSQFNNVFSFYLLLFLKHNSIQSAILDTTPSPEHRIFDEGRCNASDVGVHRAVLQTWLRHGIIRLRTTTIKIFVTFHYYFFSCSHFSNQYFEKHQTSSHETTKFLIFFSTLSKVNFSHQLTSSIHVIKTIRVVWHTFQRFALILGGFSNMLVRMPATYVLIGLVPVHHRRGRHRSPRQNSLNFFFNVYPPSLRNI